MRDGKGSGAALSAARTRPQRTTRCRSDRRARRLVTCPAVPEPRPMREADVAAVAALATLTFEDLDRRRGVPPPPRPRVTGGEVRMRRVLATDPGGCWVADGADGELAGAALALVREGVWGLSSFAVRPGPAVGRAGRRAAAARARPRRGDARRDHPLLARPARAAPLPPRGLRAPPGRVGGGRAARDGGGAGGPPVRRGGPRDGRRGRPPRARRGARRRPRRAGRGRRRAARPARSAATSPIATAS